MDNFYQPYEIDLTNNFSLSEKDLDRALLLLSKCNEYMSPINLSRYFDLGTMGIESLLERLFEDKYAFKKELRNNGSELTLTVYLISQRGAAALKKGQFCYKGKPYQWERRLNKMDFWWRLIKLIAAIVVALATLFFSAKSYNEAKRANDIQMKK